MKRAKKKVTNKSTQWIAGYVEANRQSSIENERRREEQGFKEEKGLKNLKYNEKIYVAIIVLGVIGIIVKYGIMRMF
ncbi:MAG: hypothetical protein KBS66_05705 [Eubacterium sp.]|nr:hypothetical protein [Candidatus Colimonas fimequi]